MSLPTIYVPWKWTLSARIHKDQPAGTAGLPRKWINQGSIAGHLPWEAPHGITLFYSPWFFSFRFAQPICKPLQDLKNASLAAINVPMASRCCGFALGPIPVPVPVPVLHPLEPRPEHTLYPHIYSGAQQQQHVLLFLRFGILNFYYLQFALMLWKKACGCYGFGFSSCPPPPPPAPATAAAPVIPPGFPFLAYWMAICVTHTNTHGSGKKKREAHAHTNDLFMAAPAPEPASGWMQEMWANYGPHRDDPASTQPFSSSWYWSRALSLRRYWQNDL